jgi:hypothetical protein
LHRPEGVGKKDTVDSGIKLLIKMTPVKLVEFEILRNKKPGIYDSGF